MDSEILVLIICAIVFAVVRGASQSKKKGTAGKAQGAGRKGGMADLVSDLSDDSARSLDRLIDELRQEPKLGGSAGMAQASGEGRDASPGEKTMFTASVAPEARVRPEVAPSPKSPSEPIDFAAAKRALAGKQHSRAKAAPAEKSLEKRLANAVAASQGLDRLKSGESAVDAEGCVGGSLGAHSEEGESRAEHDAHNRARAASIAAERTAARRAVAARRASIDQLRQAVVMSEILDKPKALRRGSR